MTHPRVGTSAEPFELPDADGRVVDLAEHPGGWFDRLKNIWYWGCILIPLSIAGMTVAGYYYTAQQLIWRCYASFVFVVAV